jgi:hypothetical protein
MNFLWLMRASASHGKETAEGSAPDQARHHRVHTPTIRVVHKVATHKRSRTRDLPREVNGERGGIDNVGCACGVMRNEPRTDAPCVGVDEEAAEEQRDDADVCAHIVAHRVEGLRGCGYG